MKKLIICDLDGTFAESQSALDAGMARSHGALPDLVKVAVSSGGNLLPSENQLLANLPHDDRMKNLSILPSCGTGFYRHDSGWEMPSSEDFSGTEMEEIIHALIGEMIFFGNALVPGGNDSPAKEAGGHSIRVRDPDESKWVIKTIIACRGN